MDKLEMRVNGKEVVLCKGTRMFDRPAGRTWEVASYNARNRLLKLTAGGVQMDPAWLHARLENGEITILS
jgi:hypothetical protein